MKKTQAIVKTMEKDNDEFEVAVLHEGLYESGTKMKPMTDVPEDGTMQKLAESTGFPR